MSPEFSHSLLGYYPKLGRSLRWQAIVKAYRGVLSMFVIFTASSYLLPDTNEADDTRSLSSIYQFLDSFQHRKMWRGSDQCQESSSNSRCYLNSPRIPLSAFSFPAARSVTVLRLYATETCRRHSSRVSLRIARDTMAARAHSPTACVRFPDILFEESN